MKEDGDHLLSLGGKELSLPHEPQTAGFSKHHFEQLRLV